MFFVKRLESDSCIKWPEGVTLSTRDLWRGRIILSASVRSLWDKTWISSHDGHGNSRKYTFFDHRILTRIWFSPTYIIVTLIESERLKTYSWFDHLRGTQSFSSAFLFKCQGSYWISMLHFILVILHEVYLNGTNVRGQRRHCVCTSPLRSFARNADSDPVAWRDDFPAPVFVLSMRSKGPGQRASQGREGWTA